MEKSRDADESGDGTETGQRVGTEVPVSEEWLKGRVGRIINGDTDGNGPSRSEDIAWQERKEAS